MPYIISSVTIPATKTITINPGAVIKFDSIWATLTVNGTLNASGTSISPVVFTSLKDDTAGGDTDGNNGNPAVGDWRKIEIGSGATTTLSYGIIRYGGYYDGYGVYNNGGILDVLNSTMASSSSYGIYHTGGTTNIATSTFNGSGNYGIYGSGSGSISLVGSTFYNNSTSAGYFELGSGLTASNSGNTASGTGKRGFIVNGSLGANQTWQADGVPYIISAVTVPAGKTLTVNPNAVAKFDNIWATLTVNGTLDAQGTASSSIYFTSLKDDTVGGDTNSDGSATTPTAGDWRKIEIGTNATTTLNYAKILYGGYYDWYGVYNNGGTLSVFNSNVASSSSYGVYHTGGTTSIATSTFNGSGSYGINAAGSGTLSVSNSNFYNNSTSAGYFELGSGLTASNSGNTASGTGKRGFIVNGSMTADQTWQADGVPYIISALTVPSGKTLTINPNTVVKFESIWATLTVNGTLNVQQGAIPDIVNVVYFTSLKDDTIGGDTNADGSATSPAAGDWRKIEVGSTGTATIEHAFVGYGGYYDGMNIYNGGGTLNISTTTIAYASYGIYHGGGTTNVKQSVFRNNGSYGYYNGTSATTTATNNYWGDISGPSGSGPGSGNAVSTYVDFNPWLGQSHYFLPQASSSVDVANQRILWKWATGSSQDYSDEWDNAVAKWNELDPITITETASTPDLTVEEYDNPGDPAVGYYTWETTPHSIGLNIAKLSTRAFNQIQNTATHELGHALGLEHSYWENIMYARNTFQTTFGPQDPYDYHYQWGY